MHEEAAGQRWRISADSFFQSRADGVDELARIAGAAADELGGATTALDLYSGVGVFAGVLAARGWSVTAVESSKSAVQDARMNLRASGAGVVAADVTEWEPTAADLVVADPSRNGLGRGGVDAVAGSGARRLVLVSCDAASLGRDVGLLRGAGFGLTVAHARRHVPPHVPRGGRDGLRPVTRYELAASGPGATVRARIPSVARSAPSAMMGKMTARSASTADQS